MTGQSASIAKQGRVELLRVIQSRFIGLSVIGTMRSVTDPVLRIGSAFSNGYWRLVIWTKAKQVSELLSNQNVKEQKQPKFCGKKFRTPPEATQRQMQSFQKKAQKLDQAGIK